MADSNKGLRILIVEDDTEDQELLMELLNDSVVSIQLLHTAETLAKAIDCLQKEIFDIIFLDLALPDSSGIDTFKTIKEHTGKTPVIILSGLADMNVAVEAISLGAQDYHIKGNLDEKILGKTILYSIERMRNLENLREENERFIAISKAELNLKQSEEITRRIINSALDAIICIDMEGKITVWNPQSEKIFGWKQDEMLGKTLTETIIPEEYRARHEQGLKHYQETGKGPILNRLIEMTAMNRAGQQFPVELSIVPLIEGGKSFFCAFIRDITEMKKAETELKQSSERFEMMTRTTNDAVWEWDIETGKMWGNETHQQLYGLTNADPVPHEKQWQERLHPDDRESMIKKQAEVLASATNVFITEYRFKSEKEGYINIYDRCYIVRNAEGKAIRILGSMMDITERKKAEELIRESEERYKVLVENAPEALVVFEVESRKFVSVSESAERLFKMSREELLKIGPVEVSPVVQPGGQLSAELAMEKISEAVGGGKLSFEWTHRDKEGNLIPCEVWLVRLPSETQTLIRGSIIDITVRKKTEQEQEESYKAIRKLTEHLQNIREEERAHIAREIHDELGQQLTVLKMDISWINKKIGIQDETVKARMKDLLVMLDETVRSVRRISSELRPSLLDDLGLIAAMEWQLTEFEKRFEIKTHFKPDDAEIKLPESMRTGLFRILQESLTNVARHSKAKKVTVTLHLENGSIVLSVADNGVGFDKQNTIGKKALGVLGMQERTSMMGGTYEICGKPGKGTRVVVTIPLVDSNKN